MMGAMGTAGFGLIGAGAHAVFTSTTSSSQTITAGTPVVVLSSPDATNGCTSVTIATANPTTCSAPLALNPVGPFGSTFESPASIVTITNAGTIPVTEKAIQMSETLGAPAGSATFASEMNVCIHSTDPSGTWVEANGPLSTAVALNPTVVENPVVVSPGQSVTYSMDFYAGQDSACGTIYSSGPHTSAVWTGYEGGAYSTPASLTGAAEGGVVTPILTYTYNS